MSEQKPPHKWPVTSHEQLAKELKVSPTILRLFIQQGFLRGSPDHPVAARPSEEVAEWLRLVLGPVSLRPILPLPEVAKILDYKLPELRKLCAKRRITVYPDRLFGDMVSARAFFSIRKALEELNDPLRLDRQAFLNAIMAMNKIRYRGLRRPFIVRLEEDVARIARMQDPHRTMYAAQLWAAYNDAAIMADAVVKANGLKDNEKARTKIMVMMYRLRRAIEKGQGWESVTSPGIRRRRLVTFAKEAFAAELQRRQGKSPVSLDAAGAESSTSEPLRPSDMSSGSSCAPS